MFFAKQFDRSKRLLLLVALLTAASSACGAAAQLLIGRLMDALTLQGGSGMAKIAVLLLAALLTMELCIAIRAYVSAKAMIRLSYELTEDTLATVLRTSAAFFNRTARGELLQRCTKDTRVIQQFGLSTLPGFVQELLLACWRLR